MPSRAKYSRSTFAARISFPGGLTVFWRRSCWRSCVTSARSVKEAVWGSGLILTPTRHLFLRARRQLVPHLPELRKRRLRDEPAEELDGGALRADDLVPDDARDDLVVPHPPELSLLVELEDCLGEAVEVLVAAPLGVEPGGREP